MRSTGLVGGMEGCVSHPHATSCFAVGVSCDRYGVGQYRCGTHRARLSKGVLPPFIRLKFQKKRNWSNVRAYRAPNVPPIVTHSPAQARPTRGPYRDASRLVLVSASSDSTPDGQQSLYINESTTLDGWHAPSFVWRTIGTVLLAGQVNPKVTIWCV